MTRISSMKNEKPFSRKDAKSPRKDDHQRRRGFKCNNKQILDLRITIQMLPHFSNLCLLVFFACLAALRETGIRSCFSTWLPITLNIPVVISCHTSHSWHLCYVLSIFHNIRKMKKTGWNSLQSGNFKINQRKSGLHFFTRPPILALAQNEC